MDEVKESEDVCRIMVHYDKIKHFVTRDGRQWDPEDVRFVLKDE